MTVIFHPETGAYADVPEVSVSHYRRSGWMTSTEWNEHQALVARQAAEAEAAARKPVTTPPSKEK